MVRVVLDTNVIVSNLLVSKSTSALAVEKAITSAEVVISEQTMNELADVLSRSKLDPYISLLDRQEFLRRFVQIATLVSVISEVEDCQDVSDNHFLALALDAGASYIVTGDNSLLALHPWRSVSVITPSEFIDLEIK